MSTLAPAPSGAARASAPATGSIRLGRVRVSTDTALGLCLAAGLAAVAFVTTGGVDQAPNTWTEIVLTIVGAGLAVTTLLVGGPGRRWGGVSFALFVALALLTALSITWSVQPEISWGEAGRTLSYLAVFGSGVALARLFGGRWAAAVGAIAVACAVICGYALLVKVFPGSLDPGETFGRLRAPFDYWNATGLIAAMGLPPCLWAGARSGQSRALRALTVPAIAVLLSVLVLSYSRGAVLVAVVGLAGWFVLVPMRLRAALVLALGAAGAAVVSVHALQTRGLTANLVALPARTSAGHTFGVLLAVMLVVLTIAGFLAARATDRVALPEPVRRRIGTALIVLVALLPLAGIAGLAASSRGLTGEISHVWDTLTSSNAPVGNTATRLVQLGNSRGRYWREGVTVGEHALLNGTGALGYGTAVTRYTNDSRVVVHAHSYVVETFADFGLIGLALMIAMLVSFSLAARRTLAPPRASAERPEHAALLTMLAVVVIFGLHSTIDWTWFIPGTAIPSLLCAGWLAGRGPIDKVIGRRKRAPLLDAPGSTAAVLGLVTVTLFACWAVWQPLRAANADTAALNAVASGNLKAALADANTAVGRDPVAVDPLFELSALWSAAGDGNAARAALLKATARQPENAQTWLRLGEFYLRERQPRRALPALERAARLDLSSLQAAQDIAKANAELSAR